MMGWIRKLLGKEKRDVHSHASENTQSTGNEPPEEDKQSVGYVRGRHFVEHVDTIKQLERNGNEEEAIALLLECVEATECEANAEGRGVAPWYYERLAIIYRKQNRIEKELQILEQYDAQPKARGMKPKKLAKRLEKVRKKVAQDDK